MTRSVADADILNSSRNSWASSADIWASSCSSLPRITMQFSLSVKFSITGRRSWSSSLLNSSRIGLAETNPNPLSACWEDSSGNFLKGTSASIFLRHWFRRESSSWSTFLLRCLSCSMRSSRFSTTTKSASKSSWSMA